MRRRRIRIATLKDAIKKADTLVANIGQGSTPTVFIIANTDVGARLSTGAAQTIRQDQTTSNILNVGDVVKYINVCIEVASRNITGGEPTAQDNGWLEWALVCQQENHQNMASTSVGTLTLGNVASNQYRRNCLYTGCIPVGSRQPNSVDMKFKIPPKFQKFLIGQTLSLFVFFRSTLTTDVRTDSTRVILSTIYKAYV